MCSTDFGIIAQYLDAFDREDIWNALNLQANQAQLHLFYMNQNFETEAGCS